MDSSASWDGHDPILSPGPQDDFQQFLDLGISGLSDDVNFNFQDFAPQQHGQIMRQRGVESIDTTMGNDTEMTDLQKHGAIQGHMSMDSTGGHSTIANPSAIANHGVPSSDSSLMEIDAQIQYLQLQRQQQQQRIVQEQHQNYYVPQNRIVPPTPNSIEMHSGERHVYTHHDPQQQVMYDTYQMRLREQEVTKPESSSPCILLTPLKACIYAARFSCRHAFGDPLQSSRVYNSRRIFQPIKLSSAPCPQ